MITSAAGNRNTDLQSVWAAEFQSAEPTETAENISAARTGQSPVFRAAVEPQKYEQSVAAISLGNR